MHYKICGIATNDCKNLNIPRKMYYLPLSIWKGMIYRCYDENTQNNQPSYAGCSVCYEWLTFSNFKQWYDGNYIPGYQLDKDILFRGNKVYSPITCVFVPQYINLLLTRKENMYGYQGVSKIKKKYIANIKINGSNLCLGRFDNAIDAFNVYKERKEEMLKEIAIDAFLKNQIKSDVASAIMNYSVNPLDKCL